MARALRRSAGLMLFFLGAILLLPRVAGTKPLHVGSVSPEVGNEIKKFTPLASYLAQALQSEGIDQGKVVVAKSIPERWPISSNRER